MILQRFFFAILLTVLGVGVYENSDDFGDAPQRYTGNVVAVPSSNTAPSFRVTTPAEVAVTAQRGTQVLVTATSPPTTTIPIWTPGVCESFRPFFTVEAGEFFIDRGILNRETRCGLDLLNERTGDSGPCQINPIHNRAGWFGGREFGDGGWLLELHGLTTRENLDSIEWLAACQTLFDVCGAGPWKPPYSCKGRPL